MLPAKTINNPQTKRQSNGLGSNRGSLKQKTSALAGKAMAFVMTITTALEFFISSRATTFQLIFTNQYSKTKPEVRPMSKSELLALDR
mmetsp:Transcript_103310/g.301422  ORF Transcript_103310/g.301422 Transcript_103310/m.301422 type:complete len:88 (-) Transcript_103310:182-445(-)